jgi:F0F1-type ATP synthase membrane subunit b/b'
MREEVTALQRRRQDLEGLTAEAEARLEGQRRELTELREQAARIRADTPAGADAAPAQAPVPVPVPAR